MNEELYHRWLDLTRGSSVSELLDGTGIVDLVDPDRFYLSPELIQKLFPSELYSSASPDIRWSDIIHPEDLSRALDFFKSKEDTIELRIIQKGQERSYLIRRRTVGELGLLAFIDITSTSGTAQKLEQRVEHLRQLLVGTGDLVFVVDLDYRFIQYYHSPDDSDLLVSPELFMGRSIHDIGFQEPALGSITDALNTVVKTGIRSSAEYYLDLPGGRQWFNMVAALHRTPDEQKHIICTVRNVTERVQAEMQVKDSSEKFELFFKNSLAGFFFMTLDEPVVWSDDIDKESVLDYVFAHQRVTKVNQAMLDQYGASEESFLGLTPADFFNHDPLHGRQIWREFFDSGRALLQTDERRMDGTSFSVEGDYICMYDGQGRIVGHFGVQRDVTARKKAERELEEAREKAEIAVKSKGRFLAYMSHELRTPLNGVIGYSDLLSRLQLNNPARQYAELVHQSAGILLSVVNNVLDFSRLDSGSMELVYADADPAIMARQSIDAVLFQAHQKGLELLIELDPNLPSLLKMDIVHLRQVLVNLLGNAVKFCPAGEVELKLQYIEEASKLRFAVRDTGPGIDPALRDDIFKAFSRSSEISPENSTGLGLTIASQLVELMGGEIEVLDQRMQGTTFLFEIPVEVLDSTPNRYRSLKGFNRALIADSSPAAIKSVRRILEAQGLETVSVRNLEDLQSRIQASNFDLILVDELFYGAGLISFLTTYASEATVIFTCRLSDNMPLIPESISGVHTRKISRPLDVASLERLFQQKTDSLQPQELSLESPEQVRLLIAEDNLVNLNLTRHMLQSLLPGAEIIEARDGEEALRKTREKKPHLIFLDLQMPRMDGLETARQIRRWKDLVDIPIIALTAATLDNERDRCMQAGMNDFLAKPLMRKDFLEVIERWIESDRRGVLHARIAEKTGLSSSVIKEIVSAAGPSLEGDLEKLLNCIDRAEARAAHQLIHHMRGTALSLQMQEFSEDLQKLDAMIQKGESTDSFLERIRNWVVEVRNSQ